MIRDDNEQRTRIGNKAYPARSLLQLAGDVIPFPGPRLPQIPRPGTPPAPGPYLPMELEPDSWEQYLARNRNNPLGLGRSTYQPK